MNGTIKIIIISLLFLCNVDVYAQGASLSSYDLKESYLEKKASYESNSTKEISATNQIELDRIVTVLEENAPNSYEFHFIKYLNGNFDLTLKDHLMKAYELKPDAREVKLEMFAYYLLTENKAKSIEFAKRIEPSYSVNTLNYYKILASNPKVKTLFLSGEADAYPLLVLQSLGIVRSEILVVNLDFLVNDTYRKRIQKRIGMANVTFTGQEQVFINAALKALLTEAYFSTSVSQSYLRGNAEQFFITGLYYQFKCPNQIDELTSFWKSGQQNLNALTLNSRTERALYANFLPPLLTLYKSKIENGEKDNALRKDIETLAKKVSKEKAVEEILKGYDQIE